LPPVLLVRRRLRGLFWFLALWITLPVIFDMLFEHQIVQRSPKHIKNLSQIEYPNYDHN
jgi:hypothetical protein